MADFNEYEMTTDNEVIDTTTGEIVPVENNDGLTGPETALIAGAVVAIGTVGYGIGKGIEFLVNKTKNDWIPAAKARKEEKKAAKAAKKAEETAKKAEKTAKKEPEEVPEEDTEE